MAKTFTIFFFGTRSLMILKLGMGHHGLEVYKVYINDDPGLTLDFLQKGQICQNCSFCLYKTNSQVSVYRTIGPLVFTFYIDDMICSYVVDISVGYIFRDDVHRNARRRRRIRTCSNPTSVMNKHMNYITGMADSRYDYRGEMHNS